MQTSASLSSSRPRILVVGDAMLNRYWDGSVERISPEAPVPVLQINEHARRGRCAAGEHRRRRLCDHPEDQVRQPAASNAEGRSGAFARPFTSGSLVPKVRNADRRARPGGVVRLRQGRADPMRKAHSAGTPQSPSIPGRPQGIGLRTLQRRLTRQAEPVRVQGRGRCVRQSC